MNKLEYDGSGAVYLVGEFSTGTDFQGSFNYHEKGRRILSMFVDSFNGKRGMEADNLLLDYIETEFYVRSKK